MVRVEDEERGLLWDPIWAFLLSDNEEERLPLNQSMLKSENYDNDNSRCRMEGCKTPANNSIENGETRDAAPERSWHWEFDSSYVRDGETDDDKFVRSVGKSVRRKVRFSPFKKVSLVQNLSSASTLDPTFPPIPFSSESNNGQNIRLLDRFLTDFLDWGDFSPSMSEDASSIDAQFHCVPRTASIKPAEPIRAPVVSSRTQQFKIEVNESNRSALEKQRGNDKLRSPLNDDLPFSNPKMSEVETEACRFGSDSPIGDETRTEVASKTDICCSDYNLLSDAFVPQSTLDTPVKASMPRRLLKKVKCRSIRNFSHSQRECITREDIPVQKLGSKEIPSSGTVAFADNPTLASKQPGVISWVPRSFLEYDYEKGLHMFLTYKELGLNLRTLVAVDTPTKPSTKESHALVLIEASTVSPTDCEISLRYPAQNIDKALLKTPGIDFVGRVCRIGSVGSKRSSSPVALGDRVMSLCKHGGNARYISMDMSMLIKLPEAVEPSLAVCLVETYLVAFQTLHYGQDRACRYNDSSLRYKSVLIFGSMPLNFICAVAELARAAGVESLFATSIHENFQQLDDMGVIPLDHESMDWMEMFHGRLDLIISDDESVASVDSEILTPYGEIICISQRSNPGSSNAVNKKIAFCSRKMTQVICRTHRYNLYRQWDTNLDQCKEDLSHLVRALETGDILPHVIDRIPLSIVAEAHEFLQSSSCSGFIVCEPWLVEKQINSSADDIID